MSDSRGRRRSNPGNKQHQRLSNGDSVTSEKSKYSNIGRSKKMSERDRGDSRHDRELGPTNARGKSYGKSKTSYQRNTSDNDKVRHIVKEEGRNARNLITWSVPMDDTDDSDGQEGHDKRVVRRKTKSQLSSKARTAKKPDGSADEKRSSSTEGRKKSVSKKIDLRARYWAFLFDNLQRAVDEIYQTCEVDESIVECKEVIMILKSATQDFDSLIKRINVQKDFEKADKDHRPTSLVWEVRKSSSPAKHRTPSWPPDARIPVTPPRPTSLAWEVRKSSPAGRVTTPDNRSTPSPVPVNRSLNFGVIGSGGGSGGQENNGKESPEPLAETVSEPSWADRVKGHTVQPVATSKSGTSVEVGSQTQTSAVSESKLDATTKEEGHEDDGEGWETVQRGKPNRSRPSSAKRTVSARSSRSSLTKTTTSTQQQSSTTQKDQQNNITQTNGNGRERTDSEKENRPIECNRNVMGSVQQLIQSKTDEGNGEGKIKPTPKAEASKPDIKDEDPSIIMASTEKTELLSSDDEADMSSAKNVFDEEELATRLEDVENVMTALDEEDHLTNELEKCHEEALASAIAEEENLSKVIEEEENKDILVETDEGESDLALSTNTLSSLEGSRSILDWNDMVADYEERQRCQSSMSWGEIVEMTEMDGRPPGYALHMHEKLSSPSRKRTRAEAQKRHEERQVKAQQKREKLQEEKSQKLKMLHERIEEVRAWKNELLQHRKEEMEEKQKRAELKRELNLQAVRRKAQEEEAKANEIAFINKLEAQNKKHDIVVRHQGQEARLHDLMEERQRRQEEKAAKEEAAQERRKALESERQERLEAMQSQRKIQEEKINILRAQRDVARENTAKEKAREREQRISALNAAQQAKEEEIQKKIQQKHDETMRRHSQQIEQKREKAIELSMLRHYRTTDVAPQHKPYEKKKMCALCNVMIPSEVYLLSHLRGKNHKEAVMAKHPGVQMSVEDIESYSLKLVVEASSDKPHPQEMAEKERQRASRKRARKLRQRMTSKGKEYENNLPAKIQGKESPLKAKLQKLTKDLNKYLQSQSTCQGPWEQGKVSAMDRALGEISRILTKREQADQITFRACGGLSSLSRILMLIDSSSETQPAVIPPKSLCSAANNLRLACKGCFDNCQYALYSGKLGPVVDLLMHQLMIIIPEGPDQTFSSSTEDLKPPSDPVASSLMQLITTILQCLVKYRPQSPSSESKPKSSAQKKQTETFDQWGLDIISYLVCCGVIDKLTVYFNNVRGPVDKDKITAEFLQHSLGLIGAMTRLVATATNKSVGIFTTKRDDPTQLLSTFKATGLGGIISLLYGILLHGGSPDRDSMATPPELPEHTLSMVTAGIKMLTSIAMLDLQMFQSALGAEGISLEFRHIATYLIWYSSHYPVCDDLLHEVILIVGYFTIHNNDNQVLVQSGKTPTLLQQLCGLPFQYFSDPRLMMILFPTLIACCYNNTDNKVILEQEMSCSLLATFIEEKLLEQEKAKLLPTAAKAREKEKEKDGSARLALEVRFPEEDWEEAIKFFQGGAL